VSHPVLLLELSQEKENSTEKFVDNKRTTKIGESNVIYLIVCFIL
jgi:hypothetical protein